MWSLIRRIWPAPVSLYPPDDARLRSFDLTLTIAGRAIGSMNMGAAGADLEPLLRTRLGPGFHRYELDGTAQEADSEKYLTLRGSGLIVDRQQLSQRIATALAATRPTDALRSLLDELRQAAGVISASHLPHLSAGAAHDASAMGAALDAAQARLEISIPVIYRELLTRFGAFEFLAADGEVLAALYSPEQIRSVPEWRREVRRSPLQAGNSARAQSALSALARDIVVARTQDMSWILRAGTHLPCADGSTSLAGECIDEVDPAEDLWHEGTDTYTSYFGDTRPKCEDCQKAIVACIEAAVLDGISHCVAVPHHSSNALRLCVTGIGTDAIELSFGEQRACSSAAG